MKAIKSLFENLFAKIPKSLFFVCLATVVISIIALFSNLSSNIFSIVTCIITLAGAVLMAVYTFLSKKPFPPKLTLAVFYVVSAVALALQFYDAEMTFMILFFAGAALLGFATYLILTNKSDSPFIFVSIVFGLSVISVAFLVPYLNLLLSSQWPAESRRLALLLYFVLLILFDKEYRYVVIAEDPKTKRKMLDAQLKKGFLTEAEYKEKLEAIETK